jgi:hypothetical protein
VLARLGVNIPAIKLIGALAGRKTSTAADANWK